MNIGTLEATLGVDTRGLATASQAMEEFRKKTESQMKSVVQTLDKTGRNIYYFGTAAGRYLTLPLVAAGAASFKLAKDFEFSMQKINGLVGVSQKQVNAWSKDILKMGPELGKSPKELADALYYITSSGFKGAEALKMLETSAKTSAAGLGTTADVANVVTSAMNAYKLSNLTAAQTVDVLVAAVREGKAEGADFAKQIGDVIPIAAKMGIGFDQVASAMAAITLTGSNAAEASTFVKNALFEITKPGKDARDALKFMGTSIQELRDKITSQGLLPALIDLGKMTNKYGDDMMGRVFPNIRGFVGVLSLLGDRVQENTKLFEAISNSTGSAQKAYEAISNTMEQVFNKAMATVKASMIEFILLNKDKITPIMMDVANAVKNVVGWYLNLSSGTRSLINHILLFSAVLSPIAIGVGLVMRALAGLTSVIRFLIPVMQTAWGLMAANPYMALAIVVGTLAGSYLTSLIPATEKQTQAQRDLNDAIAGTSQAMNRGRIIEFMEKIGMLKKEFLQGGVLPLKINVLDTSGENLKKVSEMIGKMPVDYLQGMQTIVSEQIIEIKRQLLNIGPIGEDLTKKLKADRLTTELTGAQQALKLIQDELTKVSKITVIDKKGGGIDVAGRIAAHKLVLEEYGAFLAQMKKLSEEEQYVTMTNVSKNKEGKTTYTFKQKFNMPEFDSGSIDNYRLHFLRLRDASDETQVRLKDLEKTTKMFSDSSDESSIIIDVTSAKVNFLKTELQKLVEQGYRPYVDMQDKALSAQGNLLYGQLKEMQHLQTLQNMWKQYGEQVQSSLLMGASSWEEYGNSIVQVARQVISAAIAQIITKAILTAMDNAVAAGPVGLFLIPALVGMAVGAANTAISQIPGLAEGGVIPNGYPNDTYPAMLTSGELVVPPGKLENLKNANTDWAKEVVFKIKGYDLEAIVKKELKKQKTI